MNAQTLLGANISAETRTLLERLGDSIEADARAMSKEEYVIDKGNNPVEVRGYLFGVAWDLKCIARVSTNSYNI